MLDQATEQMVKPQREDHSGDITALRLKSPLKHMHRNKLGGKGQGLSVYHLDL